MLPARLIHGFDERRLRLLLAAFFLVLAVPTAVLIRQAYSQLKWESFHQYRGMAEELTGQIDSRLIDMMNTVHARSFADYTFLVVAGEPSAKFVQRSPLSSYPVQEDLPGVIGYFQVDADGRFSTPLLPPAGTEAARVGIGESEYAARERLARRIRTILADNRLLRSRPQSGEGRLAASPLRLRQEGTAGSGNEATAPARPPAAPAAEEETLRESGAAAAQPAAAPTGSYGQEVFDQLKRRRPGSREASASGGAPALADRPRLATQDSGRAGHAGKVGDLNLDAELQNKSEQAERQGGRERRSDGSAADAASRSRRKEQIALPQSARSREGDALATVTGAAEFRISTFESEIDPFEFSLLDSGHFVLFRSVWRDEERYIQGLLLEPQAFLGDIVGEPFAENALSASSDLVVAYQDDVIRTLGSRERSGYADVAAGLGGNLLYRSSLSAPLNSLELVFSVRSLPPGPGGRVLGWLTLVLAIVFVGGFVAFYRLGLSQIRLARQQQDFVSAVSHELKTPLTSIRMYAEMLREGWANEEKRQSYYEFIHDESERLSRLISNVLQLARITRNGPQCDPRPVKVGELMSGIESKIASQVARAGFELRLQRAGDAEQARISVDEDCFAQIVINLVDNAIKFSANAAEKAVELGSKRTADGDVVFWIRDYGPGVPAHQRKKIFRLFYRSESGLTRESAGTGIGLAIVHQLASAMNGSVDLVNAQPGAEFRVVFPAAG